MVTQTANAACFQLGRERCRSFSTATQVSRAFGGGEELFQVDYQKLQSLLTGVAKVF
jgi:hypothetical protein